MTLNSKAGSVVLAIWLLLSGAIALFSLSFEGLPVVMGVLAVVAGVLILMGR